MTTSSGDEGMEMYEFNNRTLLTQSAHDTKCMHRARAIGGYGTAKTLMAYDTLLRWNTRPSNISIVKKSRDEQCTNDLIMVCECLWNLKQNENMAIYVEHATYAELHSSHPKIACKLLKIPDMKNFGQGIDLIIVIGGDGTLLYLVSLFTERKTVPPIVCFQRGSLGFLAPFDITSFKETITGILEPNKPQTICLRMRLTARLWKHPRNITDQMKANSILKMKLRGYSSAKSLLSSNSSIMDDSKLAEDMKNKKNRKFLFNNKRTSTTINMANPFIDEEYPTEFQNGNEFQDVGSKSLPDMGLELDMPSKTLSNHDIYLASSSPSPKNFEIIDDSDVAFRKTTTVFPDHKCFGYVSHALNEVLVHAESGASLMQADLYVDGTYCTTVQADGIIFSTPTGSTAYNISAGGSLISPTVPCIAMTPICPHTLSFRPVIVPDSTIIHLKVSENARSCADLCCDGRNRAKVERGDVVEIIRCPYPVPTFKSDKFNAEWFGGLVKKFNWNVREVQKPLEMGVTSK